MEFIKKNVKLILGITIAIGLVGGISVYATSTYLASQVNYTRNNTTTSVSNTLDDLYSRTTELDTIKTNVNQTTATAADIASGKKAYIKNERTCYRNGLYRFCYTELKHFQSQVQKRII